MCASLQLILAPLNPNLGVYLCQQIPVHSPKVVKTWSFKASYTSGLQSFSRDIDSNGTVEQLLVDERKKLMRNCLFSSTNMAAMM